MIEYIVGILGLTILACLDYTPPSILIPLAYYVLSLYQTPVFVQLSSP